MTVWKSRRAYQSLRRPWPPRVCFHHLFKVPRAALPSTDHRSMDTGMALDMSLEATSRRICHVSRNNQYLCLPRDTTTRTRRRWSQAHLGHRNHRRMLSCISVTVLGSKCPQASQVRPMLFGRRPAQGRKARRLKMCSLKVQPFHQSKKSRRRRRR